MAFLFTMAMVHCADDMLSTERLSTVQSGFCAWRMLDDLCGWDVPDAKSPPPSVYVRALGAMTYYTSLPTTIKVTKERELGLFNMLHTMKTTRKVLSGVAGQFFGEADLPTPNAMANTEGLSCAPFCRANEKVDGLGCTASWWPHLTGA